MICRLLAAITLCSASLLPLGRACTAENHVRVDHGDGGMIVSDSAVASRIGRQMLLQGGNAVDAAVATAFALAVSWPEAGNIGGGGFMIVCPASGEPPVCIDYRETAPLSMHARSFSREDTTLSRKAVGVPGTVHGLATAHQRFGKLPWREVVMPAARLAANGVTIDAPLAHSINQVLQQPETINDTTFNELQRVYGKPDHSPWETGETLVLPELSTTLQTIAEEGPDAFYQGRIADLLVQEMRRGNGEITHKDLARYRAKVRPAMQGNFRGYTIIGAPPPSSGGTCVIEALNVLEQFDLASRDRFHFQNIHLIAETCRRVFADRARYLGDPDFIDIPEHLTSKTHARELAESIDLNRATPSQQIATDITLRPESDNTTHFSVVDGDGMAVSNTYTLEASWGSRHVVKGAGFVLNNEMGDFNWFPGETTRGGRIGTDANLLAPGKRMLSSQSPTIVMKDGKPVLVTGSPGGRTIINTVICVVLAVTEFQMDAAEAVAIARMHHQWFPDQLQLERLDQPPHAGAAEELRQLGHTLVNRPAQGSAHTIQINPSTGVATGVADYRRGGRPAGLRSDTVALWDFAEPQGTSLAKTTSTGRWQATWQGGLKQAKTDGLDHLSLLPSRRQQTYPLSSGETSLQWQDPTTRVALEVQLDTIEFAGATSDEKLTLSVTSHEATTTEDTADHSPHALASLTLERDSQNRLVLTSHMDDSDETVSTEPVALSQSAAVENLVVRLEVDTASSMYRVLSRPVSKSHWNVHARLKTRHDRSASGVRIELEGDLVASEDSISIDRILIESR